MTSPESRPLVGFSMVCVALLCAVPFLQPYHRYPLTAFYSEWLAFALGIGVMVVLLERGTWSRAQMPWVALSAFALALLLVIHGLLGWSPYGGQALTGALYLIWAGALVFAARTLAQTRGLAGFSAAVAAGLGAGAWLSAVAGVIQHFDLLTPLNAYIVRPTGAALVGNLAQSNHFAAYLTLGLFSLVYLRACGRIPLAVAVFCVLPMLFVLGLSGSRSVWLYLFAAFALAAWLRYAAPQTGEGRRLLWTCGAILAAYFLMQLLAGTAWLKPADRETVTAAERLFTGAASISDRVSLWRTAWAMFLERPVFGAGWGAFPWGHFEQVTRDGATGSYGLYHHAHNLPLHLLAETGLVGTTLVAAPLAVWAAQVLRGPFDMHRWWLFAALAVIGLHGLLEYPLWHAYFLGVFVVLLGAPPAAAAFTPKLVRLGRTLSLAMLLAGTFNLISLWFDYRDFERVFLAPPAAQAEGDFSLLMRRLHRNPVLTPYIELASALPLAVDVAELEQRLFLTERTMRFAPLSTLLYRQVLLLALAGRLPEAEALLIRARRAYPAAPPEFRQDLDRGLREHPDRFRPLLELLLRRPAGA